VGEPGFLRHRPQESASIGVGFPNLMVDLSLNPVPEHASAEQSSFAY